MSQRGAGKGPKFSGGRKPKYQAWKEQAPLTRKQTGRNRPGPHEPHRPRQGEAEPEGLQAPKSFSGNRRAGREVVYGRNPVLEALRGRREVHSIWLSSEGRAEELRVELGTDLGTKHAPVEILERDRLTQLAGAEEHQGFVAEVDAFSYIDEETILSIGDLVIVLDRVQDPHNLGAVLRTAEAAGAAVVLPRHRSAEVTPAAVKASAGASEHVPVARVRNLTDFVLAAKEPGYWIYGAEAQANADYAGQDYTGKVVFCMGSEGEGLGKRLRDACDVLVAIPLTGQVASLNVSVSTAVLVFEARRQRRAAPNKDS